MNKKIRFVVIGLAVLGIQSTAWAKVKEKDLCKNPNYSHLIDSVGSQIGNMSACCTTAKLEIGTVCTPIQIIDKKKAKPNKKKNKEICLAPGFPNYFSSVSSPWHQPDRSVLQYRRDGSGNDLRDARLRQCSGLFEAGTEYLLERHPMRRVQWVFSVLRSIPYRIRCRARCRSTELRSIRRGLLLEWLSVRSLI